MHNNKGYIKYLPNNVCKIIPERYFPNFFMLRTVGDCTQATLGSAHDKSAV